MRIAIIGTGIAGNVAAYRLQNDHEITVYEASDWIGGHSNTIDVSEGSSCIPVDTGFIVYNDRTYPHFCQLLKEIGQASQASEMSFSVQSDESGLEYKGSSLNTLFAQRKNIVSPTFHRMLQDILRFNRESVNALADADRGISVGEYLAEQGFGERFYEDYLVPMAAAIWSAEPSSVLEIPLSFLVRFFSNHGLLSLKNRPQWRVIKGGSRSYVEKLVAGHRNRIRLRSPVNSVRRLEDGIELHTAAGGIEHHDAVFFACHSDQALHILKDPSRDEQDVLGKIRYQENEAILHTDTTVLPSRKRVWAAWNYYRPADQQDRVAVTYNMNILQRLQSRQTYCVTLNSDARIDPQRIIKRIRYEHPIFSAAAIAAQQWQRKLNSHRTFFCGAYWRNGFHEDGVVSALNAVKHFEEGLGSEQLHLRRAG